MLNPIWNSFHFFTLYANADGYRAEGRTDSPHLLDRYVLAKTRSWSKGPSATSTPTTSPGPVPKSSRSSMR